MEDVVFLQSTSTLTLINRNNQNTIQLYIVLKFLAQAGIYNKFELFLLSSDSEIKEQGKFLNYEKNIEKVILADIQRVSLKYFTEDNRVIAVSSPDADIYSTLYLHACCHRYDIFSCMAYCIASKKEEK